MMQHAIDTAVIERTKDEIFSELAYFEKLLEGKNQEQLKKRIAAIAKDVTNLAEAMEGFIHFVE